MLSKLKKDDKLDKEQWERYLSETRGLERDYMKEIVDSRSKWQKASAACFALAIFMIFWHQFRPVTNTEPMVLRVDNATGAVTEISTVQEQEKSYGEIVDNYFIATYVRLYESYNYHNIQDDYDRTVLMSSDSVATQYRKIYESGSESARDQLLGKSGTRKVNIISVVPDTDKGIATVRFAVTTDNQNGSMTENYVATLTYEYVSAKIDTGVRLLNPLGFVVTSYRADKELSN